MRIEHWWNHVTADTRTWLVEHNGEPLDPEVTAEIMSVTGGVTDPSWWAGESSDGHTELTDDAVDWIESVANSER